MRPAPSTEDGCVGPRLGMAGEGVPRPRHFLSSNDTGSVTDGPRLNSSVTLFPGFTKPFLFIFIQDSELNPDCPVQ